MPIDRPASSLHPQDGRGTKMNGPLVFCAFLSLALLFYLVVVRLQFVVLPAFFLVLGFATYAWSGRKALLLFLFLLPLVGATPGLFFNGYPFNYMGVPLFYLAGMLCASGLKGEGLEFAFPGREFYLLFLVPLGISAFFVYLRWSNPGLSSLAFLRDTPVAPSLERISFACLFPAITLALFFLSPFLAYLLRRRQLSESEVFVPLRAGFCLSFLLALVQKWINPGFMSQAWWIQKMNQVNGGFSDFNAFGFFAGAMFLYQALALGERWPLKRDRAGAAEAHVGFRLRPAILNRAFAAELFFLAVALAAVFLSGCRTAFLFVLAALARLFFSRRPSLRVKAAAVLLLAAALFLAGGALGKRLWRSAAQAAGASSSAEFAAAIDKISNGRLSMLRDGGRMVRRFPVSGVGSGNFLFTLKRLRFGKDAYLDLPLNQYLLFFSEIGVLGGLAFLFFLAALLRRRGGGTARFILAAMALALLFNNFFWFPEVLLLFWVFVARTEWAAAPPSKKAFAWGAVAAMAIMAMNVIDFKALHPKTWAQETKTAYDYGFSYPENESGRAFRWSSEKAGLYIYLDKKNPKAEYRLRCGAPLPLLPGKRQSVDVYWRGRPYRRMVFRENGEYLLSVEDSRHSEGFLEFRVRPAFNLKRMGLGKEGRDLGVQVSGPGV